MTKYIRFFAYRDWAKDACRDVQARLRGEGMPVTASHIYDYEDSILDAGPVTHFDSVLSFFVGWSWMVPKAYHETHQCFVVHPSALPRYRGGSPIQYQLIDGVKVSAVSLFRIDDGPVDSGPIAWQKPFWLLNRDGTAPPLDVVLTRIGNLAADGMFDVASDWLLRGPDIPLIEQIMPGADYVALRRRKPEDGELTPDRVGRIPGDSLARMVRALQDPYPNAYIRTMEGGKLLIKDAVYEPPPTTAVPPRWVAPPSECNCHLKDDPWKAPEQHAETCPERHE